MPVSEQTPIQSYSGNSATTLFAFAFLLLLADDLVVLVNDASGVSHLKVLNVDYTVAGVGSSTGGSVTFVTAPATGETIVIYRDSGLARATDYQEDGDLLSATLDDDFDRLWLALQEIFNGGKGPPTSLRVPNGETVIALANAASRANKTLGFDSLGAPTVLTPTTGSAADVLTQIANTALVAQGDALTGVLRTETNAVAQTLHLWIQRDKLRLTDFLSVAEVDDITSNAGTIDVATKFQNALTAAAGKCLLLPEGKIRVGSALTITADKTWVEGRGATQILCANGTADIFTLGDGTNEISNLIFSDFDLWATALKSAGYAFNARKTTDSRWIDIRAGSIDLYTANASAHRLRDGYYFDRFSQNVVEGGEIVVANRPVQARGNIDQSFGAELTFDGGLRIFGAGAVGILFGGATGGTYLGRVDISACAGAVKWDQTLTAALNREAFLSDLCTLDSCGGAAIDVNAGSLETMDLHCWISACGVGTTAAVKLVSSTSVNATGLRVQSSVYDGIHIDGAAWTQGGGIIRSNGAGAGGGHGINFISGRLNINDTLIHTNGSGARGRGINIDPASDNYTIESNEFFSNGQSALSAAPGVSQTKIIRNNRGYISENNGTATIANGTSSIAVNHGLADTPTHVLIAFAGAQDAGAHAYVAPGSLGATQFTITYSAVAGAGRDFWWRAVRGPM